MNKDTRPPPQFHITVNDWNSPKWVEQPMSHYSVKSREPREDFAEAFMAYVHEPSVLKRRSPRRFDFIQDRRQIWDPWLIETPEVGDFPVPRGESRVG